MGYDILRPQILPNAPTLSNSEHLEQSEHFRTVQSIPKRFQVYSTISKCVQMLGNPQELQTRAHNLFTTQSVMVNKLPSRTPSTTATYGPFFSSSVRTALCGTTLALCLIWPWSRHAACVKAPCSSAPCVMQLGAQWSASGAQGSSAACTTAPQRRTKPHVAGRCWCTDGHATQHKANGIEHREPSFPTPTGTTPPPLV